jgi:hypothetical protein
MNGKYSVWFQLARQAMAIVSVVVLMKACQLMLSTAMSWANVVL